MTTREVIIIDSGGANLASLGHAFERLGVRPVISNDPKVVGAAERAVLPGVGHAAAIMQRLDSYGLADCIRQLTSPVLGICLGMQLMFDRSTEGDTAGLGILAGRIEAFTPAPGHPVPHMGWNTLRTLRDDPLLQGIGPDDWFYFVHGYHAPVGIADAVAVTDYGGDFTSVVRRANFRGVQFHPERSGPAGARLLANFMELGPCC